MSDEYDPTLGTDEELEEALWAEAPPGTLSIQIRAQVAVLTPPQRRRIIARWRAQQKAARPNRAGPPRGTGLTLADVEDALLRLRAPDGSWPTQEAVAEELDRSDRLVRDTVQAFGGWRGVIEKLEALDRD